MTLSDSNLIKALILLQFGPDGKEDLSLTLFGNFNGTNVKKNKYITYNVMASIVNISHLTLL